MKTAKGKLDVVHAGFETGLVMKGIDGILEIVGGVLLMFLDPIKLHGLVRLLTQHELSEDPNDKIANLMITMSQGFSIGAAHFGVVYLLSHGLVKIVLILLLWQRKMFAYPLSVFSLLLFIAYQMYRYTSKPSAFLIILTVFDMVMVVLTILEFRKVRQERADSQKVPE